jgi:hypothetical protein
MAQVLQDVISKQAFRCWAEMPSSVGLIYTTACSEQIWTARRSMLQQQAASNNAITNAQTASAWLALSTTRPPFGAYSSGSLRFVVAGCHRKQHNFAA